MLILETDRLILRRFVPDDLEHLYTLYSDPDVRQYIPEGVLSYDETKAELEWFLNGHPSYPYLGLWATIYKESGEFIGRCGLLPWTIDGCQEVEVAYMIARRFWGQGLGTEAARGVLTYGFEHLGLTRLICLIDAGNEGSIKVATRIGMRFEREGSDEMGPYLLFSATKAPESRDS